MTSPSNTPDPVEVIQADRDAAARYIWQGGSYGKRYTRVVNGEDDGTALVQAFARHRLTQSPPAMPDNSVHERVKTIVTQLLGDGRPQNPWRGDAIAIRALIHDLTLAFTPAATPSTDVAALVERREDRQPIETAPIDGTHILGWHDPLMPPAVFHYWDAVGEEGFYLSLGASGEWDRPIGLKEWMPLPVPDRVNADWAGDWQYDTPSERVRSLSSTTAPAMNREVIINALNAYSERTMTFPLSFPQVADAIIALSNPSEMKA